jgi:putative sterol carrier protein
MPRHGRGPQGDNAATEAFFDDLASRGHEPLLHREEGSLRVDVVDGTRTEHFFVTVRNGDIKVSKRDSRADSVLRAERTLFNEFAQGTANAMAGILRGTLAVEGDPGIASSFTRLFPGPPRSQRSFRRRQEERAARTEGGPRDAKGVTRSKRRGRAQTRRDRAR